MKKKKKNFLGVLGLVFVIILGISLDRFLDDSEAQGQPMGLAPANSIPRDFNWEAYLQNNPDLGLAGIVTEEKARQHWREYGKSEGREYHVIRPAKLPEPVPEAPVANVRPEDAASAGAAMSADAARFVTRRSISRMSLDPPEFDYSNFRERYNKIMERTGIKTKEEAMDFSLALWEKRRRAYFS